MIKPTNAEILFEASPDEIEQLEASLRARPNTQEGILGADVVAKAEQRLAEAFEVIRQAQSELPVQAALVAMTDAIAGLASHLSSEGQAQLVSQLAILSPPTST